MKGESRDPSRALSAEVVDGQLILELGSDVITTPADYADQLSTLLDPVVKNPHPFAMATVRDFDSPHQGLTDPEKLNETITERPIIARVDVFTAYPDPDSYIVVDGATNLSGRIRVRSTSEAERLQTLLTAINNGLETASI